MFNIEDMGVPFKLIGYAQTDLFPPTFIIPIFKNLDNDSICMQLSKSNDEILSFVEYTGAYAPVVNSKTILRKLGQSVIFGFCASSGELFFGEHEDFSNHLMMLLAKGEFEKYPALGINVAKFVGDVAQQLRLKKKVFDETPVDLKKTRKFFLENNVVREGLLDSLPVEAHNIIMRTKISIYNNKISLTAPPDAEENIKREVASSVTQTFRDFMESPDVEVRFNSQEDSENETIRYIHAVRSGRFGYDPKILDFPEVQRHFTYREGLVLIPQAAQIFISSRMSKTNALHKYFQSRAKFYTISDDTIRKILSSDSVSLISAILFRMRVMGNYDDAVKSKNFRLHVACFRLNTAELAEDSRSKLIKTVYDNGMRDAINDDHLNTLMPLSMLGLINEKELLSLSDIRKSVVFSRSGFFSTYRYNVQFFNEWIDFCGRVNPTAYHHIQSHIELPEFFRYNLGKGIFDGSELIDETL